MTSKTTQEEKKDSFYLIEYRGGGYDGCIWEWNYAVVGFENGKRVFHDVFSSGAMARKSVKALRGAMKKGYYRSEGTDVYDISDKESMTGFVNGSNPANVKGALIWIDENIDMDFFPECPVCNCEIEDPHTIVLGDFTGNGGIGIESHSFHCQDCDNLYTCSNCREYDSTTTSRNEDFIAELEDVLEKYVTEELCDFCFEDLTEDLETAMNTNSVQDAKNTVTNLAYFNGHVLSAWFAHPEQSDKFESNEATDCINCKERYTLETHPTDNKRCTSL